MLLQLFNLILCNKGLDDSFDKWSLTDIGGVVDEEFEVVLEEEEYRDYKGYLVDVVNGL